MKRLIVAVALFALLLACSIGKPNLPVPGVVTLEAQSLPTTRTLAWDAVPFASGYVVTLDGQSIGTPTTLSQAVTLTTAGPHTFTVAATNLWGTGPAATYAVNVVIPAAPTNVHIQ